MTIHRTERLDEAASADAVTARPSAQRMPRALGSIAPPDSRPVSFQKAFTSPGAKPGFWRTARVPDTAHPRSAADRARARTAGPERRRMKKNAAPTASAANVTTLSRTASASDSPSTLTARSVRSRVSAQSVRARANARSAAASQIPTTARRAPSIRDGSGTFSKS
jgi:hypothetical protein